MKKRRHVHGVDMFDGTSARDSAYTLDWFDALDDALAFAEEKAREPHAGADAWPCDLVRVTDEDTGPIVFSRQRPPG